MEKTEKLTFDKLPEALTFLIEEVADLKRALKSQPINNPKVEEEEYLTPSEFAQSLKISMVTLWHWDNKGIIKPLRVGNLKRYRRSDLEKIMVEYSKVVKRGGNNNI